MITHAPDTQPGEILHMPADRKEREKHRKAGEQMVADKARHVTYQAAIRQMNQPAGPVERWVNWFFVLVAVAGGFLSLYFIAHQVWIWAQ